MNVIAVVLVDVRVRLGRLICDDALSFRKLLLLTRGGLKWRIIASASDFFFRVLLCLHTHPDTDDFVGFLFINAECEWLFAQFVTTTSFRRHEDLGFGTTRCFFCRAMFCSQSLSLGIIASAS